MATYTQLKNGSKGDDVKKLQQTLVDSGYSVGNAVVDGIYGSSTAAAVKKYQKDNNLTVDGIAGNQTLGKLYGGSTATTETENTDTTPDYSKYGYDSSTNTAYMAALDALNKAQQEKPMYNGTYDQQITDVFNKIVNRDKFTYDLNSDSLYQQYKDQYVQQGKLAMQDAAGQAATATGGYGNTYAETVGQQTYQAYLQNLNDKVPELYSMAQDQYNQEGQDMLNEYSLVGDMADNEYSKYNDSLDRYWQDVSYKKQEADDIYDRDSTNWYNAYQLGKTEENTAYAKQETEYNKLVSLITTAGYSPTTEELQAAGMSESQAKAYKEYYEKKISSSSSGSSGNGGSGGNTKSVNGWFDYDDDINDIQKTNNGGSYYTQTISVLKDYKKAGKSNKQALDYLNELLANSVITQSEYTLIYNKYRDNKL